MADLDEKYIQNLDKSIISMNSTLQNLNETLKGVKSSMVAAFDPNIVTPFQNAVRGLKIGKLIDAEGSTEDIDKVYKKMMSFGAMMKSGVKWELMSPEMIERTKKELVAIETELEKVVGKRLQGTAWTERDQLYKERDRLRNILSSESPLVPVKLTSEELAWATEEWKRYHDLYQNMRKGSAQRAAELANLHKQEEKAKKADEDALKPKRATERTRILNKNARETQKIQEEATATLQKRKELEEQLSKLKPNGKKWREVNTELEAVNKQVSEYIAKLGSLGGAGQRQLDAFRSAGLLPANADKQLAIEKEQIDYIKKRNALLKANANIQENIRNRQYAGTSDAAFEERMTSIINRNTRSIADYNKKILADRKNFTQTTLDEITRLERQHANDLTVIAQRGADERNKIDKKAEQELEAEKKRAEKKKADAENQRIKEAQANNKAETAARDKLERAQVKARTAEHRAGFTEGFKKIDNESIANLKRQAELKQQITKIDHDRQLRAKSGAQVSQQQLEAENRLYSQLQSELSKLIAQQKEREKLLRGTTAQANSKLGGYFGRLESQEAQRYAAALREAKRATQSTTKPLKDNNKALNDLRNGADNLGRTLAAAFGVQQIKNFVKQVVTIRGEFEMQEVALRNIIGNQEKSQQIWKKTMSLAVNSPLTAQQLVTYTKQLAAFRIETDKLYDTTKMLADVSVGLGVDMQRLILAYGHTKSSGFLRGMYARQFATAGVNIYGELADYYSEIEKRTVTFKEVYERISKKMVTFADVEKVFEKLTSEGGTFYNMQQELSDTVQGQINKIKDSWQQAMNDMGSSETGVIRGVTNIALQMVKNWRTWLSVIEATGAALGAFKIGQIIFAFTNYSTAVNVASKNTLKLRAGILKLNAAMAANPWALAAAAVVAIGVATVTAIKHMNDFNAAIDKENTVLYDARQKLLGYQDAIKKNNDTLKEAKKGSEEYKTAQEENQRILRKIRKEYPELAEGMTVAKDGYVVLTSKIDEHNRALEHQIYLNNLLKQGNIFNESTATNFGDYTESLTKKAKEAQDRINKFKIELQNKGIDIPSLGGTIPKFFHIDWTDQEAGLREYNKLLRDNYDLMHETQEVQSFVGDNAFTTHIAVLTDEFKTLGTEIDYTNHAFEALYNNFFNNGQGFAEESVKLYLSELETQLKGVTDKDAKKEIESWFEEDGDDIATIALKHGEEINKLVEKGLITANAAIRNVAVNDMKATDKESQAIVNNSLRTAIAAQAKLGELSRISREIEEERTRKFLLWSAARQERLDELEAEREKIINSPLDFFAEKDTKNTNGGENDEIPIKQYKDFSALLDIIKKMNSEYKKLSKSAYGHAKSVEVVKKNYQAAFESILGKDAKALVNWDSFDFTTTEGVYKALQELEDSLTNRHLWGQYGENIKKLQDQLKREIAEQGSNVDIEFNVRLREDFGRQMEEAFGDYELTLDLQKLNLPQGLAAEMWGIDELDLSQLRKKLNEEYQKLKDENGEVDQDDFKKYEGFLKRIDNYEQKQQRERLKDYAKYLEYQYSERTKLEMEYVRKVAKLNAETSLTAEQRAAIRKGLDREFAEASKKQDWEDFKSSEFYVQMMEDLEKQGTASLEVMKGKLIEMRQNAENLPPRALKEVVNALEKIEEIESSRVAPLRRVREEMQKLKDVDIEEVYRKQAENNKAIAQNEEELRQLDRMIMLENERNRLKEQGITEEEALHRATVARERVRVAQLALNTFGVTGSKEDTQTLSILNETLNNEKSALEQAERVLAIITGRAVVSAQEDGNKYAGMSISELRAQKEALEENKKTLDENSEEYQKLINIKQRLEKAWDDLYNSIKDYAQRLTSVFDNIMDAVDYFTDNTYGMTSAWKEFGDTASSALTELVDGIQTFQTAYETLKKTKEGAGLTEALMSGDLVKLALVLLGVIIKIVQAIAKLHDAKLDKEIQKQQEKIEDLQRAYGRLEKQIGKTLSTASYMSVYSQHVENLREQIDALEKQRAAEEAKKNTDTSKVQSYTDAIQEAEDELEGLQQEQIEVFGGIGKDNYRSWAEGFVDAWKDAFLETGDGLDALQDHFDEFLQEWFVKQATMRIAANALQPLLNRISNAVSEDGIVDWDELQRVRESFSTIAPDLSERLKELINTFDINGEGSLSGLAAGIQGMTEEQADVLASYWNSVRMYTASIDANVAMIANALVAINTPNTNPMLNQLTIVAQQTTGIRKLLDSVSMNNGRGSGLRVYSV